LAQRVGRVLLQDIEEVVVADLEHFRDDAHTDGVALAEVEVDHDLPGHCSSLSPGGPMLTVWVTRLPVETPPASEHTACVPHGSAHEARESTRAASAKW